MTYRTPWTRRNAGKTLRMSSHCGPCLTNAGGGGPLVGETARFWLVGDANSPDAKVKRVSKGNYAAHIEPCRRCQDHALTVYPEGYMD